MSGEPLLDGYLMAPRRGPKRQGRERLGLDAQSRATAFQRRLGVRCLHAAYVPVGEGRAGASSIFSTLRASTFMSSICGGPSR